LGIWWSASTNVGDASLLKSVLQEDAHQRDAGGHRHLNVRHRLRSLPFVHAGQYRHCKAQKINGSVQIAVERRDEGPHHEQRDQRECSRHQSDLCHVALREVVGVQCADHASDHRPQAAEEEVQLTPRTSPNTTNERLRFSGDLSTRRDQLRAVVNSADFRDARLLPDNSSLPLNSSLVRAVGEEMLQAALENAPRGLGSSSSPHRIPFVPLVVQRRHLLRLILLEAQQANVRRKKTNPDTCSFQNKS
ncbi:Hypothetical protein, putative, partial [Bodo saltans]